MDKPFVLIIEDERDIAALFRHVMDMAGYRTEIAARGKRALERVSKGQPDIVLLDLTLPEISGAEILEAMRADEHLKNIPVVVITAHPELAQNLNVEPDLVMLKPVSSEQLTSLAQRLRDKQKSGELAPFEKTPWDKLTGLYNRSFFFHRLEQALKGLKHNGHALFAVLLVGPGQAERQAGRKPDEKALREMAELLRHSVRPTDTIARFEQDHFFMLIENLADRSIPEMIARRVQEKLSGLPVDAAGAQSGVSIGVLLCDAGYGNAAQVQRDLRSMYATVFEEGPTQAVIFDRQTVQKPRSGTARKARPARV